MSEDALETDELLRAVDRLDLSANARLVLRALAIAALAEGPEPRLVSLTRDPLDIEPPTPGITDDDEAVEHQLTDEHADLGFAEAGPEVAEDV